MSRWDVVWGGGVMAVLAVLCTQVVRSVREVLAVERRRRKVAEIAGRGQSDGARPDATVAAVAPPPGVVRGAGGFLPAVGPSPVCQGGFHTLDGPSTGPTIEEIKAEIAEDAAARVVAELEGRR